MPKCHNCGEQLWEEAIVCPTCSVVVRRAPNPAPDEVGETASAREEEPDPFGDLPASRVWTIPAAVKKLILAGIGAVLLGVFAWQYFGRDTSQSSPERTVRSFFQAVMKQDAEELVSYMYVERYPDGQNRDSLVELYKKAFADNALLLNEYEIVRLEEDRETAVVSFRVDFDGPADERGMFSLRKMDDKWFILLR